MSYSNEVNTDPRLEKRTRRRFSVTEKKRLLAEADALGHGGKGASSESEITTPLGNV